MICNYEELDLNSVQLQYISVVAAAYHCEYNTRLTEDEAELPLQTINEWVLSFIGAVTVTLAVRRQRRTNGRLRLNKTSIACTKHSHVSQPTHPPYPIIYSHSPHPVISPRSSPSMGSSRPDPFFGLHNKQRKLRHLWSNHSSRITRRVCHQVERLSARRMGSDVCIKVACFFVIPRTQSTFENQHAANVSM